MFCFFKQKTAYEMRISDWSSDVCSSDLATTASSAASSSPNTNTASATSPAATTVSCTSCARWPRWGRRSGGISYGLEAAGFGIGDWGFGTAGAPLLLSPIPNPQSHSLPLRYPSPRATARRHHGHAIDAAPALRSELRLDGVQRGAVRLHAGVDGGLDQRRAAGPRGAAQPPLAAAHGRALLGAGDRQSTRLNSSH